MSALWTLSAECSHQRTPFAALKALKNSVMWTLSNECRSGTADDGSALHSSTHSAANHQSTAVVMLRLHW